MGRGTLPNFLVGISALASFTTAPRMFSASVPRVAEMPSLACVNCLLIVPVLGLPSKEIGSNTDGGYARFEREKAPDGPRDGSVDGRGAVGDDQARYALGFGNCGCLSERVDVAARGGVLNIC